MKGLDPDKVEELIKPKRLWIDVQADTLYEFAKSRPEGFKWYEAAHASVLNCDRTQFYGIVRALRLRLAEDEITLICNPDGVDPWTYMLVGLYDDAEIWAAKIMRAHVEQHGKTWDEFLAVPASQVIQ